MTTQRSIGNETSPSVIIIARIVAGVLLAIGLAGPSAAQPTVTRLADGVDSVFEGFYNSLVVSTDPAYGHRADILQAEIAKLTDMP